MLLFSERRHLRLWAVPLLAVAFSLIGPGTAGALTIDLNTEFDTGVTGDFAQLEITENAGALDFVISLNLVALGAGSDLHEFYFNLEDGFTGLAISDTDAPNTEYVLSSDPSVAGGAGSDFDWEVNFGKGGGRPGNGKLQTASFTLTADQDLSLTDLFISSFAQEGTIEVQFATHVQGTSALTGANSETIGGSAPIPEPATGPLVFSALGLLGFWRRRAGQRQRARSQVRA
jgi:hypothetical protein